MPGDQLTNADNFRIMGSLTVINDPQGNSGNTNLQGTLVTTGTASFASNVSVSGAMNVTGTASFASGFTASSISAGGLNSSFSNGLIVSGGLKYDAVTGGFPATTTSSQNVSSGNITMTSGIVAGGPNVIYVNASGTATGIGVLTPTASSATSGLFQDGLEVTIVNLSASGSRVQLPSASMGSFNVATLTISEGRATRFKYNAVLQTWIPLVGA